MHRLMPLLLVLALPLAGCLDGAGDQPVDRQGPTITGEPSGETLGDDEYWMVWVEGHEVLDPPARFVCSVAYDHSVDAEQERVTYSNHTYGFDPAVVTYLVAFDVWEDTSSCPLAYSLHTGQAELTEAVGGYGNLTLVPATNGSVMLEPGTWLHPGQQARYSYEATKQSGGESYDATGWFNVTHMGAWPQDGLEPG